MRWDGHQRKPILEDCEALRAQDRSVGDFVEVRDGRRAHIVLASPFGRKLWQCSCGRRVERLFYLYGPRGRQLACRFDWGLVYRSSRRDRRVVRLLTHPERILAMTWPISSAQVWVLLEALKLDPFSKWRGRTRRRGPRGDTRSSG